MVQTQIIEPLWQQSIVLAPDLERCWREPIAYPANEKGKGGAYCWTERPVNQNWHGRLTAVIATTGFNESDKNGSSADYPDRSLNIADLLEQTDIMGVGDAFKSMGVNL